MIYITLQHRTSTSHPFPTSHLNIALQHRTLSSHHISTSHPHITPLHHITFQHRTFTSGSCGPVQRHSSWNQLSYDDKLSPITVCERRVARARRSLGLKPFKDQRNRGDQTDQATAGDHRTTDINNGFKLFPHPEQSVVRTALQRLRVK